MLGVGATAMAFDLEMLGWVKRKTIFIPEPQLFYPKFYTVDIHRSLDYRLPDQQAEFQEACALNRSSLFTRQIICM